MEKKDNLAYLEEVIAEAKKDENWDVSEEVKAQLEGGAVPLIWKMLDA